MTRPDVAQGRQIELSYRVSYGVASARALLQLRAYVESDKRNECLSQRRGVVTIQRRMSPGRLERAAHSLTDRDRALLETLANVRLATTTQIERLHFVTGSDGARRRNVQRTMQKLVAADLVMTLERRIGGVRAGSAGQIYALAPLGQHLMTKSGPAGGRQIRRAWTPSLMFVRHRLATTELYVRLVEADRHGDVELLNFIAEPASWRSFNGQHGGVSWVKPDAYVLSAQGDFEDRWFIEIDCGTESPSALMRKCRSFVDYHAMGREQAAGQVFPVVLFVVPSEERAAVVAGVFRSFSLVQQRLFRVETETKAVSLICEGAA